MGRFTWNAQDNLTAIDNTSGFTAGYTADGLRAWKAASGAGTAQTYFLYDGSTPIIEMDSSGNVTALNTFGADGLVSRWESQYDQSSSGMSGASDPLSGSSFYTFDERGNASDREFVNSSAENPPPLRGQS